MIIDYCDKHGSITAKEAQDELGVARLASRIHDIRNSGLDVHKEMVTGINRFGDKTHYARYTIAKEVTL